MAIYKCKRCGRPLKNKESIKLGYGLICAKKESLIRPKIKIKKQERIISLYEFF